ncbi:uroporphyrin-III C-methyltransferase, partial [Dinochytrium kinnereticum]
MEKEEEVVAVSTAESSVMSWEETEPHSPSSTDSDTDITLSSSSPPSPSPTPQPRLPSSNFQNHTITPIPPAPPSTNPSLTLIGAGPGSPGLLTLAALESLHQATLIIIDRLVPQPLLHHALKTSPNAPPHILTARKHPGRATEAQDEINEWMVEGLRLGHRVVRVKGGDPFVFGRGGEEVIVVRERFAGCYFGGGKGEGDHVLTSKYPTASHTITSPHHPPITIIPGISSSLSAPLLAGIPVTHRGVSDQILIATGQKRDGSSSSLAVYDPTRTTVLLMAMTRIGRIVEEMVGRLGYPGEARAVVVEKAGCEEQRVLRCEVRDLPR